MNINEGLINLSGSCYINAVLQALFHFNLFREYIMKDRTEDFGELHRLLKLLLISMQQKRSKKVNECHAKFVQSFTEINKNCKRNNQAFFIYLTLSLNNEVKEFERCLEFRKYIIYDQQISGDYRQTHSLLKWLFVYMSITDLQSIDTKHFYNIFTAKHMSKMFY